MLNYLREIANHYHISGADYDLARGIIGSGYKPADLVIAPDGSAYLYRWHIVPLGKTGNVYFHIQVANDPLRPLHDHPWDNMSVILAGRYIEFLDDRDSEEAIKFPAPERIERHTGDVIFRKAHWGHRLLMPKDVRYTMTLFSTGPKVRKWGFWYSSGWVDAYEVCRLEDGVSVHMNNTPWLEEKK